MQLSRTPKIISNAASVYFGLNKKYALDNAVLEATLRYIAIKSNSGDIEQTQFINFSFGDNARNNIRLSDYIDYKNSIIVFKARAGYEVSIIPEEGWVSLDNPPFPTARFLSQVSPTSIYVNSENKTAVILVKTPTERWIDNFCSTLYRILIWLYPQNSMPTQEEIELFRAISTADEEKFISIVDSCYGDIDFEAHTTKKMLAGWANKNKTRQLKQLTFQRNDIESDIRNYEQQLQEYYQKLSNIIVAINGWMNVNDKEDLSVYNFFTSHKQLKPLASADNGDSSDLDFSILETLEYFDDEEFMNIYNEKSSVFYQGTSELARRVAYEVFVNKRGCFRLESVFRLTDLSGLTILKGVVSNNYNDISMPHPHLYHYGCLGGNKNYILEYLKTGDWDLAIEQAIVATKNLRFGDYTVFGRFLSDIERYKTRKCIVLSDGTDISPQELYDKVLKEDEEKSKTEEA